MDGPATPSAEDPGEARLSDEQQRLVEMYARDPNPARIAAELGVHRSTVYRRLDEPGVQEAVTALRIKLDAERNTEVEEAQDLAIALIKEQLERLQKKMKEDPDRCSVGDAEKLMRIAEKLGSMKRDARKTAAEGMAEARKGSADVDWDSEPGEEG